MGSITGQERACRCYPARSREDWRNLQYLAYPLGGIKFGSYPTIYVHVLAASILGHDDMPIAWLVHEYKSESYGTRMRSTFRLPAKTPRMYRSALRKHNKEEMQQFTEFLPELYARDLG